MIKQNVGFFSLLGAAIIYSTFGIWMRLLGSQMSVYQATVLANLFAAIFAAMIIIFSKKSFQLNGKYNKFSLIAFVIAVPAAIIFYNFSVLNTKVATATFALYASSLVVAFAIGNFVFKEVITPIRWVSFALALIGLFLLSYPFNFGLGFVMGLLSGVFDCISNILKKNLVGIDRMLLVLISRVGAVIVSVSMILMANQKLLFINNGQPVWVVLIAVVFGVLFLSVIYLTIVGFQRTDVSLGTIILASELFFTPIVGYLAFREIPSFFEVLGGAAIFIAMIIPNINLRKNINFVSVAKS